MDLTKNLMTRMERALCLIITLQGLLIMSSLGKAVVLVTWDSRKLKYLKYLRQVASKEHTVEELRNSKEQERPC